MGRVPEHLADSPTHQWVWLKNDGTVVVGITDHARAEPGDLVYVDPPRAGSNAKSGEPFMTLELVKEKSDVHAPISGEVVEINEKVVQALERINQNPYDAWLVRIRPSDPGEHEQLVHGVDYRSSTGES